MKLTKIVYRDWLLDGFRVSHSGTQIEIAIRRWRLQGYDLVKKK